jgi:hypothetical protein
MTEKAIETSPRGNAAISAPGTNLPAPIAVVKRPSWKRFLAAFVLAAISDVVSFFTEFVPPLQWVVDGATALLLFLILGRRWAILPGLVAEAIPGMGIFPVWVLVVLSILLYDEIKLHKK